jgi:hypothetical protein
LSLLAWADGRQSVYLVYGIAAVALLGAAFDVSRGLPKWDNRFSPGFSGFINVLFPLAVLGAVGAALYLWGQRHAAEVESQNRRRLVQIIEEEPRCGSYFDIVTRVTPHGIARAVCRRSVWPNLVKPAQNDLTSRIFRPEDSPVVGGGKYMSDLYWRLKDGRGADWLRFLREQRLGHEFPSPYFRALLAEAVEREHGRWLEALGPEKDGGGKTWLDRLPGGLADVKRVDLADGHFARYLTLREAQIEAEHVFFKAAPVFNEEAPEKWLKEFNEQMAILPKTETGKLPQNVPSQPELPKVAEAYLQLWLDQVDWLFILHGEQLGVGMERDRVNFRQLTRNVLATRGAPQGFHQRAAALALSMFAVGDEEWAKKVATSLYNYYAENTQPRPVWWHSPFKDREELEIALAVSTYMLWRGVRENWNDEVMRAMTLPEFPLKHAICVRVSAHIRGASMIAKERKQRRGMAAETELRNRWAIYVGLPTTSSEAFTSQVSGDLLGAAFLFHFERGGQNA